MSNTFERREIKYILNEEQEKRLIAMMKKYMALDEYGESTISSIYIDTPQYLMIRRSIEKPVFKEKFRIRSYGEGKAHDKVYLEIKRKIKKTVYKRRVSMSYKEAVDFIEKGKIPVSIKLIQPDDSIIVMPNTKDMEKEIKKKQILNELLYMRNSYVKLKMAAMITYDRKAYFGKEDESFRITIDRNIRMRDFNFRFEDLDEGTLLLPKEKVILEIKTKEGLPKWMLKYLNDEKLYKSSFSKYGEGYRQIIAPKMKNTQNEAHEPIDDITYKKVKNDFKKKDRLVKLGG